MFKFLFHYRITLFFILNAFLMFNHHVKAQEESAINVAEEEQPSEKKLIRVRRVSPTGRGSSSRAKSPTRAVPSTGNTNPIGQGSGRRSPSLQQPGSNTRDSRSPTRSSTKSGRKRPSPTKSKGGSPPKQARITQKPVDPGTLPVVYAPSAVESNDRFKSLQRIAVDYRGPFTFRSPSNAVVTSIRNRNFRLQWRTNGESNAGMEHILKRHTREFHDGSFKKKQSMFPEGTTHTEIRGMIQKVVENPQSNLSGNTELGVEFRQIEAKVAHQGKTLPLVVGYRKNVGLNKPLDIVQAYPKGMEYEVSILPRPKRRRRALGRRIDMPRDPLLGILVEREAIVAEVMTSANQYQNDLAMKREQEEEQKRILRNLALDFSSEESQSQSISIMWGDNASYPPSLLMDYTLFKNNNPVIQKNNLSDSPVFIDQPDTHALTTYLIKYKDRQDKESSSAVLTVGAEKITNLQATIVSDYKILLNWDSLALNVAELGWNPFGHKGEEMGWAPFIVNWAIFRNGEIIDIGEDATSFEDKKVEPSQTYVYRIIAFIEENDPWENQRHTIFYSKPLIVSTEKAEDFEQDSFLFYTYLLSKPVTDSEDLRQHPDAYYTSIKNKEPSSAIVQKSIVSWEDNTPIEMLDGLIDVELNGRSLVSSLHFDNVRMLWDYLLAMVEQYLQANQATIYFPSQPIPISLKKKASGTVEFQIDNQFVTIDEKKCLTAILQGAKQFFTLLNEVSTDKYSLLIGQIEAMQGQVDPLITNLPIQTTLSAQVDRISLNRVLLSWVPSDKDVKSYKILLDEQAIITLPAHQTSYIHIFQPKEQTGKSIYKLVAYGQDGQVVEDCSVEIEIADSYLQIGEVIPLPFEISWTFPAESLPLIGYYEIFRNGISLGFTNSTTYTEIAPAIGKYTYEIKALDGSKQSLDIASIIIEKTVSKQIELNWIFPEPEEGALRMYGYRRYYNGSSSAPSTMFNTTIVDTIHAAGKYIYEISALDLSETNSTIGSLTEEVEITQQDISLEEQKPLIIPIEITRGDIPLEEQTSLVALQALARRTSVNEVLLSWTSNSTQDIKSYEVLIDNEPVIVLSGNMQKYTHNIEETGHLGKCTYKLVAYDQNDRECESIFVEFEIATSYLQVEKVTSDVFELKWVFLGEEADSIEFYNVYRDATSLIQVPKDVTIFSDTTRLAPGAYTYRVVPLDENGSLKIEPAVREIIVTEETYLRAQGIGSNIKLSWNFFEQESLPIHLYHVFRNEICIGQLTKETTTFTDDTTLLASGEYTYVIEAVDNSRNILETKQIVVKIDD